MDKEQEKKCVDCGNPHKRQQTNRCIVCAFKRADKKTGENAARLQKLDGSCLFCLTGDDLIVHHIDNDHENDKLENLLRLCRSCHGKLHGRVYAVLFAKGGGGR